MSGLFFDIRNYFEHKFSGRYIARLLRELARHEPASFSKLVAFGAKKSKQNWNKLCADIRKRQVTFECEGPFQGKHGTRRADLVVLNDGRPKLYFEVKEDDVRSPHNSAQLEDYLAADVPFIHLSRFAPEDDDQRAIDAALKKRVPVASIRYRDVHKVLRGIKTPVAKMVREYLEDINVGTEVVPVSGTEWRLG